MRWNGSSNSRQAAADERSADGNLYNRRMLDQMLPKMIEQRCQDNKSPLSMLMIDVDHFKELNDTLGHAKGDQMLQST